jgi:predicted nucleic acid-binding protein
VKRLRDLLKTNPTIGLDTSVFIYHLEDNPRYASATDVIFTTLERGENEGITSYLTLLEVLTKPKAAGFLEAARDYEYYLTTFPNLTFFEMGLDVAKKASDLRAVDRIKTPDAIQVATALHYGATMFITNDRSFERVKEIEVLLLDKFLKS